MRFFLYYFFAIVVTLGGFTSSTKGSNPPDTSIPPLTAELPEGDDPHAPMLEKLTKLAQQNPFHFVATLLFFGAIVHTFFAGKLKLLGDRLEHQYHREIERLHAEGALGNYLDRPYLVSFEAKALHFLGEVEAVFGIWCLPLLVTLFWWKGWDALIDYIERGVNYTEPMFVVVIMAIASTRPVIRFAESVLEKIARLGGGTLSSWWLTLLIICPLMGSLITEPAAMTIAALLLSKKFYRHQPARHLAYATLGLLFVNVSVGGTMTHFAAPPVLMVAGKWNWDTAHMFTHFGWKAILGIVVSTGAVWFVFRNEFRRLSDACSLAEGAHSSESLRAWADRTRPVPLGVTLIHLLFLVWTVVTLHHPVFFLGGFLYFLAFVESTMTHQNPIQLRGPLMVGFFLASLVTFGPLQRWWLEPVLSGLGAYPLFFGATFLTAFNDNAAITFLASQVPALSSPTGSTLQYMVLAGAVTGGGLTVIANAPNPAGQSILQKHFDHGVSPLWLLLWAFPPTLIQALCFLLLK